MPPRNCGEDDSAVISTAEGIKHKIQQLHLRLQSCVESLELVSGSAGGLQHVSRTPSGAGVRDAHCSSNTSALRDDASAQQRSQPSTRPAVNGVTHPDSYGGPGSDEVEWEEDGPLDEVDEGVEMSLEELEHLRGSAGPDHRPSRYAAVEGGEPPPSTPPAPSGASISSALKALKHNLSPAVRSSLQGARVPTHGEQLRSQYQKAVGDTVQRRLVGRADTFLASGGLTRELSRADSLGANSDLSRASSLTRGQPVVPRDGGSGAASPGIGSPLRALAQPALGPATAARAALRAAGEPGQQQRSQLPQQPASGFRPPPLQTQGSAGGVGEPLQPEDGVMSPSSTRQDGPGGSRPTSGTGRSRIPQPQAASRFAPGEAGGAAVAPRSSGLAPQQPAAGAGEGRERHSAAAEASSPQAPSVEAAEDSADASAAAPPVDRLLSRSREQFSSIGSTGSGGLGWKFLAAESGGSMLISVGSGGGAADGGDGDNALGVAAAPSNDRLLSRSREQFSSIGSTGSGGLGWKFLAAESGGSMLISVGSGGGAADGGDGDHGLGLRSSPRMGLSVDSPRFPFETGGAAQPGTQSSGGGSTAAAAVVGFVPPPALLSGAVSSGGAVPAEGFVPPPDVVSRSSADCAVVTTPVIGFVPPPELMRQGSAAAAAPSVGFVPSPEVMAPSAAAAPAAVPSVFMPQTEAMGYSSTASATTATVTPTLSLGFVPPPEVMAAAAAGRSAGGSDASSSGGAANSLAGFALGHDPILGSFNSEPMAERPATSMAVRTVETVRLRATPAALEAFADGAKALASRIPVGDFSFGINAKVFSSSSRLKIRSSGDNLPGGGRQGRGGHGLQKVSEEAEAGHPQHNQQQQQRLAENPSMDSSAASAAWPPPSPGASSDGGSGASATAIALEGRGSHRSQGWRSDGMRERLSSDVSGVPGSADEEEADGGRGAGGLTGKLPWEESSSEEGEEASSAAPGPGGDPEGPQRQGAGAAPGSPFASAVATATAASVAAAPPGLAGRPPPRLKLSPFQEAAAEELEDADDDQMFSPLQASGISVVIPRVDEPDWKFAAKQPAVATARASSSTALTGRGTVSAPPPAPLTLSRSLEPTALTSAAIHHRLSTGGNPPNAGPATSPRVTSGGADGVSITITDSDIARSGGVVPALLEIVRERFRQKGFHNLAHLAAAAVGSSGGGAAAAAVAEANSAPLSPALRGETLAERIVARVENFQTRKTEGLVLALVSSAETEDGSRQRGTEDGSAPEGRRLTRQSTGGSTESGSAVALRVLPQASATYVAQAARHPSSGIPSFAGPPSSTMPAPATTRFAAATAGARAGSAGGDGGTASRSSPPERKQTATATSHSSEPSRASSGGFLTGPRPTTLSCTTASNKTHAAPAGASTLSRASTPAASPAPSASSPPSGAAAQAASPASSAGGGSCHKAEQGTQTPPQPERVTAGVSTEAAGDRLPPEQQLLPQGTAQAFFLSTTVPLSPPRPTGSRGGAPSQHDADRLLQPPDSPTICTAADFFRGAASRATLNTSTIATPLRQSPSSGAAMASPFIAAAAVAATAAAPSLSGVSPHGARPRSARESTTLFSHAGGSSTPASRPRRQSMSGRVSISAGGGGGPLGRAGGGGGRVVIDEAPIDMETQSSSRMGAYQPRRLGTVAGGAAAAGHSTARVAFEEVAGSGTAAEPGTGRSLTREMLMRLAHLGGGREQAHAFETTTDEEREEQERQAKRRARRERALAGQMGSSRRRTTGDFAGSSSLRPEQDASSAHHNQHTHRQQYERSGGHGGAGGGALPRQLAVVLDQEEAGAASGTRNSSPAIAAAPGDLIALPPLSLDAPDMPEPGGGDAPGCAPISPVSRARGEANRGAVAAGAGASQSQLPHDSVFIPPLREWGHGRSRTEEPAGASAPGRRAAQSAGGGGNLAAAAGTQQAPSRLSRAAIVTEGGGAGHRSSTGRHRRSNTAGTLTTTTATTTSWSDGSDDEEDEEEEQADGGGGAGLAARRRAHQRRASASSGAAGSRRGARASRSRSGGDQHAPGRAAGAVRSGGRRGAAVGWGTTGDEEEDAEEGDLPSVPFGSFEVEEEEDDADGAERLSLGPSSAAASVLSQRRYVAAARAHRSVSEANSAKRLSSGALRLDEEDDGDGKGGEGGERSGRDGVGAAATVRRPRASDAAGAGEDCRLWQGELEERVGRRRPRKDGVEGREVKGEGTMQTLGSAAAKRTAAVRGGKGAAEQEDKDGPATWRSPRGEAELAVTSATGGGGLTPNGSRIRQSLQRLLDLRASASSSGHAPSGGSGGSEQSVTAPPAAMRPGTGAARAGATAGSGLRVAVAASSVAAERGRPSPTPSVTATAGGTTEADTVERDAPLGAAAASRLRQARPAALAQQQEQQPRRRQLSSGSRTSSGDAPPEDPPDLVSPNYTQDMAEEEYGWDVATGDADVDNLTSPRGRGGRVTPRRGGRKTPPPPLPFDPAEVPSAGVDDVPASYTRELEQQVLLDAVSELLGSRSSRPPSEGSRAGTAEEEPSFSLTPRGRSPAGGAAGAGPQSTASRRSSPSLLSGSWRGSGPSSPGDAMRQSLSLPFGSPSGQVPWRGAGTSPPPAGSPEKSSAARSNSPAVGATELAAGSSSALPSWLSAVLSRPRLASDKATAAAAATVLAAAAAMEQPRRSGDDGSGGSHGAASPKPTAPVSSPHAVRAALAELLSAVRPLSAAPDHSSDGASSVTTMQISLESAGAAGALESLAAAAAAAASPRSGHASARKGVPAKEAEQDHQELGGSGRSSASSSPDPELRRLLLSAWSRWYLRKALGPAAAAGGEPFEDNRAAAAAQARLQALAAAHSRAGSEAWDGVSPSMDLMEAANVSRLHITFTRWLGQARSSRRTTSVSSSNIHLHHTQSHHQSHRHQGRWAEPRGATAWDAAPTPSASARAASHIAPPYPTMSLVGSSSQPLSALGSARPPSAPAARPGAATDWAAALRAAVSPPPQPRASASAYYGGGPSPPLQQYGSAGAAGIGGYAGGGAAAAVRSAGPSGLLSTPTVSRTSGVRQIPSQSYQQQQQQPWQAPPLQQQPQPSYYPSPRQQQYDHHQPQHNQPPPPWPSPFQQAAPQQQVASWLSAGSPRPHTAPQQRPAMSPRPSVLLHQQQHPQQQHPAARPAGPAAAESAAAAAAPSGNDLESYMALQLLDGLGSGSDGVILAGLQLATGGAFQLDRGPARPPSPRPSTGVGASEYTAAGGPVRPRAASAGRATGGSSPQHSGLLGGGGSGLVGGAVGAGVASAGSILERPLLSLQQHHAQVHAVPVGGGGSLARAPASPRLGVGSGGGSSSGGSSLARGTASPRLGVGSGLGSGAVGYGGVDGGLLGSGTSALARAPASPRPVRSGAAGGSGGIDLLRAAPSSPRPSLSVATASAAVAGSLGVAPQGSAYYSGLLQTAAASVGGAVTTGQAGRRPAPYASPRSTLLGTHSMNDNIRAPDAGSIDPTYYGLRP